MEKKIKELIDEAAQEIRRKQLPALLLFVDGGGTHVITRGQVGAQDMMLIQMFLRDDLLRMTLPAIVGALAMKCGDSFVSQVNEVLSDPGQIRKFLEICESQISKAYLDSKDAAPDTTEAHVALAVKQGGPRS